MSEAKFLNNVLKFFSIFGVTPKLFWFLVSGSRVQSCSRVQCFNASRSRVQMSAAFKGSKLFSRCGSTNSKFNLG